MSHTMNSLTESWTPDLDPHHRTVIDALTDAGVDPAQVRYDGDDVWRIAATGPTSPSWSTRATKRGRTGAP